MNLKFSIRDLLFLIAVISVACAALANSGIWWHSIVVTATLLGMTGLVIWGTLTSGSSRAFACGWLLFAAGYLALVFGPWTGNNLGANLITTRGLAHLELKALVDKRSPPVFSSTGQVDFSGDLSLLHPGTLVSGTTNQTIWTSYPASTGFTNVFDGNWISNYTTFQSTGHWLFASVFGYIGAHLAAFLFRRCENASRSGSA